MRKGQVWIETVLYTLIGLALIGAVLAIASPKINEAKDRIVIDQTISSLNLLDQKVIESGEGTPGNVRRVNEFKMKKGKLKINETGNEIIFELDGLGAPYSEPGIEIFDGRVGIQTIEKTNSYTVVLKLHYGEIVKLIVEEGEITEYPAASISYTFVLENIGDGDGDGVNELKISEISGG